MDYYSFNRTQRDCRLNWPCWLTDSGCFTHKVVTRPAVSLAQDRESSPARTGGLKPQCYATNWCARHRNSPLFYNSHCVCRMSLLLNNNWSWLSQGTSRSGFLSISSFQSPAEWEGTGKHVVTSRQQVPRKDRNLRPAGRTTRLTSDTETRDRRLFVGVTDHRERTGKIGVMWSIGQAEIKADQTVRRHQPHQARKASSHGVCYSSIVLTTLENLENLGNFLILENSGNFKFTEGSFVSVMMSIEVCA